MIDQKALYLYNHKKNQQIWTHDDSFLMYEKNWIERTRDSFPKIEDSLSYSQFKDNINQLIKEETENENESSNFVSYGMNLEQFKIFIQEFAVDGFTEAQVFYYVMPRLHLSAQLPLLRIMIDEFGSGNPKRSHTTLYCNLLEELDLPTQVQYYYDKISITNYEFVNLYYWLTLRADDPSYFVGALTYLESIIPYVFPCYVDACKRLNITSHQYYSEHCHIDTFHSQECYRVLNAMQETNTLNAAKAWEGVLLSSIITNHVFEEAVAKAKNYISSPTTFTLEETL
ncbi:iron-containing redox enzyme family protein [Sessilibacter corallicola]|uniref:Iron-containing redox enzyme family protein n=1 Tax=Sessilibacter corallicola TaxID=2904075 RepID=A0ABQ0A9N2_9GAMM